MPLSIEQVVLGPGDFVLDGKPSSPRQNEQLPAQFAAHVSCVTKGNDMRLEKFRVKYDLQKFSFSNRVVNIWNSLPNWVVSANTTNTFKARLDKFWHNQDVVYDFKAQLQGTGSRSECLYEES